MELPTNWLGDFLQMRKRSNSFPKELASGLPV